MKNIAIVVLVVAVGYLSDRLVREENQRFAMVLGMCPSGPNDAAYSPEPNAVHFPSLNCLETVQTRVAWWWHLYYAVTDHLPPVPLTRS